MKLLKLLGIQFCLILLVVTSSSAQGTFSYHFGLSFPSGNFADDDYDKLWERSGGAGMGLDLGLKYLYPLNSNGLNLFAGVDLNAFALKKDIRDDFEDINTKADITLPKYLSLPISGGLNYKMKVNDKVSLYGEGGIALGILKMTNYKAEEGSDETKQVFDLATNAGYKIGAGLILNDKMEIGITHFGLGKYSIDNEVKSDHQTEKGDDIAIRVEYTMLTLGFYF